MSTLRLSNLSRDTFQEVTSFLSGQEEFKNKSEVSRTYAYETQTAGVKELAALLKGLELSTVCDDYLHVEYKEGANRSNKMMLSKRFIESFEDKNVESWFGDCEDQAILAQLCSAMGYKASEKTPVRTLRKVAVQQVYEFGERVVLQRLDINLLRQVCDNLNIAGADNTSSKNIIINAIMTNSDIEKAAPQKKRIVKGKKKPIEDATKYQELFQHYLASELREWSAENGLKVSGTKKILIERILAFNAGDKENTMATATNRAPRKPATKKAAPALNPPTKRVQALASGVQSSKKIVCDVPKVTSKKTTTTKTVSKSNKKSPKTAKVPTKKPSKKVVEPVEEVEEEEVEDEVVEEVEEEVEDEVEAEEESNEEGDEDEENADEEDDEEESADEASIDEEAQQAAIDAERELRTVEEEEEDEDEEMNLSEDEPANDYPTDITGLQFALSSIDKDHFTHSKKELIAIITANGGIIADKLTRKVNIFIGNPGTKAHKMAEKVGIQCVGEEYFTNFL